MPLRLTVEDPSLRGKHLLGAGETVVGSNEECGVRLAHPTVSRRHALLVVDGAVAWLEDLQSSNGTTVDGQSVRERMRLQPGSRVQFGTVETLFEEIAAEDLETAIAFENDVDDPVLAPVVGPRETAAIGAVKHFAVDLLPNLLRELATGRGAASMAQKTGAALFGALPVFSLEIRLLGVAENPGTVYRAEREGEPGARLDPTSGGAELVEVTNDQATINVEFLHPIQAAAYRPLVESCAMLVALAGDASSELEPAAAGTLPPLPEPETTDRRVQKIYQDAARVARGLISVLITGESGTGKEVLARYLHQASDRAGEKFVALNCAALPRDLLEAELFGVEKGAATGVQSRAGVFELAHQGTLFLDEIGDMATETQARILRVLQEKEVYRVGGSAPRPADARVLAATNRELGRLIESGAFRSDLLHRISDWSVELPPLRDRRGDIGNLAAFFLRRSLAERGRRAAGVSRAALELLMEYQWPGNIRELEREMARVALFLDDGDLLRSTHCKPEILVRAPSGTSLRDRLLEHERDEITAALARHAGSVTAAAKELEVGRSTLYRRIQELEIQAE